MKADKSVYYYGYNIVVGCFLIQFVTIGVIFSYGVFLKQFQVEFGWSRAAISGASSLNFLLTGIGSVFVGRLNDKIGPRLVMIVAGIMLFAGYMLMWGMQEIWQLYLIYGVIIGIAISAVDIVTLSTVARWYIRKRGIISGIVKVGTGSGQLIIPLGIASLIVSVGWRNTYVIAAVVSIVILMSAAFILRRDPEGMGLLPDGDPLFSTEDQSELSKLNIEVNHALVTRQFWILCLVLFSIFFCLISVVVHVYPHARDAGLSTTAAAAILSTSGGVSMLGRMVMGYFNDRIGGKNSMMICFIILMSALILLEFAWETWMFFLFAAIYGFAHGGIFTVISPIVAEYFGLVSHGALLGIIYFIGTIGGAVGPFVTGRIYDLYGSYTIAFTILIGMVSLALVLIRLLKPIRDATLTIDLPAR